MGLVAKVWISRYFRSSAGASFCALFPGSVNGETRENRDLGNMRVMATLASRLARSCCVKRVCCPEVVKVLSWCPCWTRPRGWTCRSSCAHSSAASCCFRWTSLRWSCWPQRKTSYFPSWNMMSSPWADCILVAWELAASASARRRARGPDGLCASTVLRDQKEHIAKVRAPWHPDARIYPPFGVVHTLGSLVWLT